MALRILVTGSNGQLGNELKRLFKSGTAEIGPIPTEYEQAHVDYVDYDILDITDPEAVEAFVSKGGYHLIVNCAAVTNVDGCETDETGAFAVNALGAENVARAAAKIDAKVVHVSTDYVFSGTEPGERFESDPTGPVSAYGRTKLEGERRVVAATPKHFIVRTAWLYGYVGKNFVKTMRALGATHDEINVVADQLGNPTSANDLAYEILKIALGEEYGVYHVTNNGICSWADFAEAIMKGSDLDCAVNRVTSAQYKELNPGSADRPAFSALRNGHLESTVGDEMRDWKDALTEYLTRLPELDKQVV